MTQKKPALKKSAVKRRTAARKPVMQFVADHDETWTIAPEEERRRMIEAAAYRIAEQRGFHGDQALKDWLQAEAEVDAMFTFQN